MAILETIQSPADIKRLRLDQLETLGRELREMLITVVAVNGGHLAPTLGAMELTLAVHHVFDAPRDRIVWDIGHQAYAHKILTGRRDQFSTIRQYGGLSGFLRRAESVYDTFGAGHAATSISAALGMAEGLHHRGEPGRTVAIIGDGAMTAGIAFEGLNNAGQSLRDLIVILNDNEMSISPNVGAISSYLSRKLTSKFFMRLRARALHFLESLPAIGEEMAHIARKGEEALIGFFTPGMLFEALGFQYFGPIDGHRLDVLVETLQNVKREAHGPVLVHVLTQKGRGFGHAEKNPVLFHGLGPFDPDTGEVIKETGPPSYTGCFAEALIQLAKENERIVAITAAMPSGTGLDKFGKVFPHRFYDVGIAEQHAVCFAAGLATEGIIPVCAIYATFLQRAYDQVIHDVAVQDLHVVFAMDRAGIVGADGHTHQGLYDIAFMRCVPGMVVMAPKDENELGHMLKTAVDWEGGPIAVRYPRGPGVGVPRDAVLQALPVGKADVLTDGDDLLIVALGTTVYPALQAAQHLAARGMGATVVNARFVKPIDGDLMASLAARIGRVLTVEEHVLMGGFGSAVLEALEERGVTGVAVKRLGTPDIIMEHGAQGFLRKKYRIDAGAIEEEALTLIEGAADAARAAG